jgi:drug/metabolite transporter (DMT)-like permease
MVSEWLVTALLSMLAFSGVFLLYKKVGDLGVSSEALFLYYFAVSAIILFLYMYFNKMPLGVSTTAVALLLGSALLGVVGNILMLNAMKGSTNPGYALAVVGANTLLVAVASVFIFKSDFTLVKGVGTLLAVLGVILIGL